MPRPQVATRGRPFNFRSSSRPTPDTRPAPEDTNRMEDSRASHTRSPTRALSTEASSSHVSKTSEIPPEDPPASQLAQGPLWGLWLLWDKHLKVTYERLTTAKSVKATAKKYFNSVTTYNPNFKRPNQFSLVHIVQIDRTALPRLLILKVINAPFENEFIPLDEFWTIHVYDDLGSTLSLLLKEQAYFMISGHRISLQKLIILNSRDINKYSQIFINFNDAFPDRVDLFMNNINKTARLQTSVHTGPPGEEIPSLIHILPYSNTKVSALPTSSQGVPIPSKTIFQPPKGRSEVRALFQSPRRGPETITIEDSPQNKGPGAVRDQERLSKNKKDPKGSFKRTLETSSTKPSLSPSDIIEEFDDESIEVENDQNSREMVEMNQDIEMIQVSDDDKSPKTSPRASGLRAPWRKPTVEKNAVKNYEKLGELKAQLDEVVNNSNRQMLREQRYAYGIVQAVLEPKIADPPGTYRVRIFDETYDGVLLRIHEPGKTKGVRPSVDEIIRVHRICVQLEKDGENQSMVLSLPNHRSYVLFDSSLENIHGPIIRKTIAKKHSFDEEDEKRIRKLRSYLKARKESLGMTSETPGTPDTPTNSMLRSRSVSLSPEWRTPPRRILKKSESSPENQDFSTPRSLRSRSSSGSPQKGHKELEGSSPPSSPRMSRPGSPTKSMLRSRSVSLSPVKRYPRRRILKKSENSLENQDFFTPRSLRSRSTSASPQNLEGTQPQPSPKKLARFQYPSDQDSHHSMRTAVSSLSSDEDEVVVEAQKPRKKRRWF